ncbi:MAG: chemotaxis protein CheW [Mariprofundaceae bacterium]
MSAVEKTAHVNVNDCWKRIGVWGDKECPELAHCLHCRNCEVYSRIGRQLFDREAPADYLQNWTELLAEPKEKPLPGRISVLIFRLGPEWFALATSLLVEVLEIRDVHRIPHRSNPVLKGLINVHGEMQLCVSIAELLGVDKDVTAKETGIAKAKPRLLLVSMEGEQMAFCVSEACGVHLYHPSELQALPATLSKEASASSRGLLSWQDRHVAVLDENILVKKLMGGIQ